MKHNDKHYRKLIQTALQDNNWRDDELCELDWLLYRVRMGGNALRMIANFNSVLLAGGIINREFYLSQCEEYLAPTNEDYYKILDKKNEKTLH